MTAKSSKRHRGSRQREASQRRRDRASQQARPAGAYALLRTAAQWPLHECLLTKSWQQEGQIVQILVARRSPQGRVATGTFLVDLGCLGVKSAFASLFDSQREYEQQLRRRITSQQPMKRADLNLVAKIIRESIAYARRLDFKPDPDYRDAMIVLSDADPDACDVTIPLGGKDGKPLFIAGPYDNVPQIMSKLRKAVGADGFHFVMPLGDPSALFGDF